MAKVTPPTARGQGPSGQTTLPPLAQYRPLAEYVPSYGDYVVWSGWVTTWHGVVSNYDPESDDVHIIFAGVPFILFTMANDEQDGETRKIKLSKIKMAHKGNWAILQHDYTRNTNIWYI